MKLLMCPPDYYGIEYEINPWMHIKHAVDHQAAVTQWNALYDTLSSCGAEIALITPIPGLPDMVFTANAGLLYQSKIILPHFKFKERQGELPHFQTWFHQSGFKFWNTITSNTPYFEGAGDALAAGSKLFVGYGFRSDYKFYEQAIYLNQHQLIYCELNDPFFYHIDTCFCPLNDTQALWYPEAFTKETQIRMSQAIELLTVPEQEAKRFACNAVVLGRQVILPANCPDISSQLICHGFTVHACEMDEYLKAGGACKCLTLRLD